MKGASRSPWPPAIVAVLCVVAWIAATPSVQGEPAPDSRWLEVPDEVRDAANAHADDPPPPPAPTLLATALLKGNTIGDTILGDWTIARIEGPDGEGAFAFGLRRGSGGTLTVRVTPVDAEPHRPPLRTEAFDYYYDSIAPDVGIDDGAAVDLLRDLAALIEGER